MTAFRTLVSLALLVAVSSCTKLLRGSGRDTASTQARCLSLSADPGGRVLSLEARTTSTPTLKRPGLLRSQLRNNSSLDVVDAEVIELLDVAAQQADFVAPLNEPNAVPAEGATSSDAEESDDDDVLSEKDLEAYEHIFADASYWRQLGEEYQNPLIVTGTVHFMPHQRSGMVSREREIYDSFGRRQVVPTRTYSERRGYVLSPKFIFIDGGTGATLYTERHREEILYDTSRNTPALSSYFELMDRLLPSFLGTLATDSIRGTRVLIK